jgi:hypothetical protein
LFAPLLPPPPAPVPPLAHSYSSTLVRACLRPLGCTRYSRVCSRQTLLPSHAYLALVWPSFMLVCPCLCSLICLAFVWVLSCSPASCLCLYQIQS